MQRELILDSICFVKYEEIFIIARPFFDTLSEKDLVIEFQHQSAINQILESFLNMNTL